MDTFFLRFKKINFNKEVYIHNCIFNFYRHFVRLVRKISEKKRKLLLII